MDFCLRRMFSRHSGGYGGRERADLTEKGQMDRSGVFGFVVSNTHLQGQLGLELSQNGANNAWNVNFANGNANNNNNNNKNNNNQVRAVRASSVRSTARGKVPGLFFAQMIHARIQLCRIDPIQHLSAFRTPIPLYTPRLCNCHSFAPMTAAFLMPLN
jgi:hypothetical protein